MRSTNLERIRIDTLKLRRGSKHKFLDGESPRIEVHYGPTGTGKTRTALDKYPDAYLWDLDNGGTSLWLDGYTDEEVIIVDECRGPPIEFSLIKRLCDWHPLRMQAKGTSVNVIARTIVFTSTQHPLTWCDDLDGEWKRRLNEVWLSLHVPGRRSDVLAGPVALMLDDMT